jgi:hypothetical protein
MGKTAYLASLKIRIRRLALLEEAAVHQRDWSTARMAVLKRTALQEYRGTISGRVGGRAIVGRESFGVHRTDSSTETSARDARVRAWIYVFECYERKLADAWSARTGEEAKGDEDDRGENGTQG